MTEKKKRRPNYAKDPTKPNPRGPHKAKPLPAPPSECQPTVKRPVGRPTKYRDEFVPIARAMAKLGATDNELAEAFDVRDADVRFWMVKHPEFAAALKVSKAEFDNRVKRSLAMRAVGFAYEAVKIFMPAGATEPVYAKYMEYVPPDPGAAKMWLSIRDPEWRAAAKEGTVMEPVIKIKMVQ